MSCAHPASRPCARSCARPVNARFGPSFPAALALLYAPKDQAGVKKSHVGPPPIYSYVGPQYDADGVSVGAVPAWHDGKGVWCGPGYTNLFAGDPSIARSVTLTAQKYTLTCDAGSVSCSYGTATPSSPLTFTATAGNTTFTPTGVTKWQLTASNVPYPHVPPGTTVASAAGTSGGNGLAWEMDTKMTAALSGKCTIAALVTMSAGSADLLGDGSGKNTLSWRDAPSALYYQGHASVETSSRSSYAYDGTTYLSGPAGTWSRGERHIKIIQINAAGTHFRVGNKRCSVDASVNWTSWTAYDGSLNPLAKLRAALNLNIPMHFLGIQIWNAPEVSEVDIEKQFKAVGVM